MKSDAMTPDPRENLPSGSSAKRYLHCPGSFLREQECPPEEESEDSKEGTFLHAVMAGKVSDVGLGDRHRYLVNTARRNTKLLIEMSGVFPSRVFLDDERDWLIDPDTLQPIGSGQIDYFAPQLIGDRCTAALMQDYKFGRNGADDPEDNEQVKWYAAIKHQKHGMERLVAAINQPAVEGEGRQLPPPVEFDREALDAALRDTINLARRVRTPGQPICPGVWCRYCPCKGRNCPECQDIPLGIGLKRDMMLKAGDLNVAEAQSNSAKVTAKELELYDLAEWIIDSRRLAALEQLRADPKSIPGWVVPESGSRASVADTHGAIEALKKIYPSTDFTPALVASIPKLTEIVKRDAGVSGKAASAIVDGAISDFVKVSVSTPKKPKREK